MDYLKEHLNVWWLRPEQSVWDARASEIAQVYKPKSPSLDLGCGNGLYSFISAGGAMGPGHDWFVNSQSAGFGKNRDSYDVPLSHDPAQHILKAPQYQFDFGFDHKENLLAQAARLGLYKALKQGDGNLSLPFADNSLKTVYSNILYWLKNPVQRFKDISRVLDRGGRAIFSLQDPSFKVICESYQWRKKKSNLLRMLNRGRAECSYWTATLAEIKKFSKQSSLKVIHAERYLSPRTLKFWDVGLRPLFPPLLEMTKRLPVQDRLEIKRLWIDTTLPLMSELLELERKEGGKEGGYHFVVLERV